MTQTHLPSRFYGARNAAILAVCICCAGIGLGRAALLSPGTAVAAAGALAIVFAGCTVVRWPVSLVVLVAAIAISGLVDWPRTVTVGHVNASAAITVGLAVLVPIVWLAAPRGVTRHPPVELVFLFGFTGWAIVSLLIRTPSQDGVQNVAVWFAFTATTAGAYVEIRRRPASRLLLRSAVIYASLIGFALYSGSLALGGLGANTVISPRPFALFALFAVCLGHAGSRAGYPRSRLLAVAATALILLSLSRTASAAAFVVWALSLLTPGRFSGRVRFAIASFVLAGLFVATAFYFKPLEQRFTTGDVVQVETAPGGGGFGLNVQGRLGLWQTTWQSFESSPVIGHGPGAAEYLIVRDYGANVGQPHNDYLRILNDLGLVGFSFWVLAYLTLARSAAQSWAAAVRVGDRESEAVHCAAVLALAGLAIGMITDNAIIYLFVMVPFGVIVASSLALTAERPSAPGIEPTSP